MSKNLFFSDNTGQNIRVKVKNQAKLENNNSKNFNFCLHPLFDPN